MATADASRLDELVRTAQRATFSGRLEEAARAWDQVLKGAPEQPQALFFFGQRAMTLGNAGEAARLFRRAAAAAPREPMIAYNLALACRAAGDGAAALAALDQALAIDPYCFPALLTKAAYVEKLGERRRAARLYKDALTIAPPDEQTPPDLRTMLARAREAVRENSSELERFLRRRLADAEGRHPGASLARFEECLGAATGTGRIYEQKPTLLHFPRLPAIPFFDRADFPWLGDIEAQSGAMREELGALLEQRRKDFRPYVARAPGSPVNQWAELNHSLKWSALFLWDDGVRNEDHCRICPRTAAALERAPLARVPGTAPSAFFSALEPHTHIPPHNGVTNTRLIVHVPIIVPGPARFRVGNETREWRLGEAWVFDDTIEHEAWNDADEIRIILIFDIWHPWLTAAERDLVSVLVHGLGAYYAEGGSA